MEKHPSVNKINNDQVSITRMFSHLESLMGEATSFTKINSTAFVFPSSPHALDCNSAGGGGELSFHSNSSSPLATLTNIKQLNRRDELIEST